MKKSRVFLITAALLVFVSVFGAWTNVNAVNADAETRYADAPLLSTYANITYEYTSRNVVGPVNTTGECPFFYPLPSLPNSCGAVAGAELVAFYDRYFPDLIPNWTPYYTATNIYRRQDTTVIPAIMQELYTLMRTNVDDVGVSETDFLNGLRSYFTSKGRQLSYQSVMSGGKLNYEQCKNAVNSNKAIVLFTEVTNVYQLTSASNKDTYTSVNIANAHIMIIFGYFEATYYYNGSMTGSVKFVNAAMGKSGYSSVFYDPNSTTTQAAYIVNVQ